MLSQFNFKTQLNVVTSVFMARLKMISRYKGGLLIEILIPTFLAAIPILLGRSLGGENIEENFLRNTGTANYVAYMVIGANIFMIVAGSLWNFGFWVRREQQTGTLESIYLTPTNKILILGGVAFYGAFRNIINFGIAFILGCYIFGVNPFQGNILVAILFLSFGLIPIYGLSFLYGALILKLKEANALIQLAQWIVA
ncbi:MAG: ABC transporter permease, partial [Candidatus Methanofastidiosia archaeon]